MEQNIIILSCSSPWCIRNQQTGEVEREGVTIWYIMADELKPVMSTDGKLGYDPVKTSLDKSFYDKFKALGVPGAVKARMKMTVDGGKPVLKIDGIDI